MQSELTYNFLIEFLKLESKNNAYDYQYNLYHQ